MERRDFLRNVAWGSLAAATGLIGHNHAAQASDFFRAYRIARPTTPWLLGVQSVFRDSLEAELTVEHGTLPEGLRGTFYRNGPALFDRGGRRLRHWFDGDGMLHAFHLDSDGVRHQGRFVATQKRRDEAAAGDFLYPGYGTRFADMKPAGRRESNAANINVIQHGGKLLALWESDNPYEIDPASLETKGPLAHSPELEEVPFSAHPVIEADGTLWNFGMVTRNHQLVLYEISPRQELKRVDTLKLDRARYVHDFTTTQRYLVFLMPPMVYDHDLRRAGAPFIYAHRWEPERGIRALVVDKQDFSRVRRFDLPAGFIYHFAGAWNDSDGTVHLETNIYDDAKVATQYTSDMMRGVRSDDDGSFWAKPTRVTLPARERGTPELARLAQNGEFPRIHPGRAGQRYRWSYMGARVGSPNHPFLEGVQRIDRDTGKVQRYRFGDDAIAEEHIPVPKPGSDAEQDVWLIGTHLDLRDECTKLAVFEGSRVEDGPIWQARLPYALPMGLHGNFAAA